MSDTPPLMRRMLAAESAVAKFDGASFLWGRADCLRLAAHVLRELGHAPPLRQAGEYRTLLGAKRALQRTGHSTLEAWVDSWGLPRIPPAMTLPGDIVALPGVGDDMPALTIQLSNGRLFGFLENAHGAGGVGTVLTSSAAITAWSVT